MSNGVYRSAIHSLGIYAGAPTANISPSAEDSCSPKALILTGKHWGYMLIGFYISAPRRQAPDSRSYSKLNYMSRNTPIVLQLQELAADGNTPIPELLRKALLIATKLGLKDFRQWVLNELNGYDNIDDLPDYRVIYGDLRVHNPYRGYIPFVIQHSEISEMVRRVQVMQSVDSLSHVLTEAEGQIVTFPFPPEAEAVLMRMQDSFAAMRPTRVVACNQIVGILEQIRTHLLNWALQLEAEGVLGEGLTFSETEKRKAEMSQSINIHNFQGVLGNVSDSQVQQDLNMTVTPGNFGSLASYLASHGVSAEDLRVLEDAVRKDPQPNDKTKLGDRVSAWIGKMIGKAAQGGWNISLGAAGNLLASAIAKFYGLP